MALKSLGVVKTGANPVRATTNLSDPTATVWAHSFTIQRYSGTSRQFAGDSTLNAGTGNGVFGFIPELATGLPQFWKSETVESQQFPFDMSAVYVDSETAGEDILISYIEP